MVNISYDIGLITHVNDHMFLQIICDHLHKRDHIPYFVKNELYTVQLMLIPMEYFALV